MCPASCRGAFEDSVSEHFRPGDSRKRPTTTALRTRTHFLGRGVNLTSVPCPNSVCKLPCELGFSRQENRKAEEGSKHPDRNAQFDYINAQVLAAQAAGQPVISVDTKKKELVGNYRNGGTDYRPKGDPKRVKAHDFEDKNLGKVAPYGVYDIAANSGWVSAVKNEKVD